MKFSSLVRAANAWRSPVSQVRHRSKSLSPIAAQVCVLESRQLLAAPVVQPKAFAIYENSVNGAFIGTINATDTDQGQSLTFSIESGNDDHAFAINPATGVLSVNNSAALNFEAKSHFSLQIKATDNGIPASSGSATVTATLLNVNEPPAMGSQSKTIQENRPKGTFVADFNATDPDDGQTLKYSITAGNTGNAFAIDSNTGIITVNEPAALNYENSTPWQLTVFATDNGAEPLAVAAQLNVFLSDVDEGPPVIPRHDFQIGENSLNNAFIGTIKATSVDTYQPNQFAITAGNINNAFRIDPDTGVLSVNNSAALNFETNSLFQLTVTATEKTAPFQSGSGVMNVFLRDVNEAPTIISPRVATVPENSPVGTVVATMNTVDPDAGNSVTYEITDGNQAGAFVINPTTGVITVANATPLDWENQPPFNLTIAVKDNGQPALSSTAPITILLSNANDAPGVYDATVKLAENSEVGTHVLDYKVVAKDQDAGDTLSFSITGGNEKGAFAIDPATGIITVKDKSVLNFETNPSFTLTIKTTDNGSPVKASSAKLVVNLTNVNESPNIDPQAFAVKTFSAAGTVVGTVKSTDPDANQTRVYSIVSGNGLIPAFDINAATGAITVKSAFRMLFAQTVSLVVRVTDVAGSPLSDDATVTIHVNATGTVPAKPGNPALLPSKTRLK